jgi:phage virion morphogenesis protein
MNDLEMLEHWTAPLLERLTSTARMQLAREIARDLRQSQRDRIKDQKNPDGSDFAPRKYRQKKGRIKRRAMFTKLRTNRYLKQKVTASEVTVGFYGRVSTLARVHQEGLRDRIRPNGPDIQYEERQLLGFSNSDRQLILDKLIDHLTD